jgi:tetratricopeptide (TPR) repeat protein
MFQKQSLNDLINALTGYRPDDRTRIYEHADNIDFSTEDDDLFKYLRLAYSYIPMNLKDFNQDELEKYQHQIISIFLSIAIHLDEIGLPRRLDLVSFLIDFVERRNPRNNVTSNTRIFDFSSPFEHELFEQFTSIDGEITESLYPYAFIYIVYGDLLNDYGDRRGAMEAYSKANSWNPISPSVLQRASEFFDVVKDSQQLYRTAMVMLKVSYRREDIAEAMQYIAYALYLEGKFEQAYAYYYVSLEYSSVSRKGLNERISATLTALKKDEPYPLTKNQIKALFPDRADAPQTNPRVYSILRTFIIDAYNDEDYVTVLDYAPDYIFENPHDGKIRRLLMNAKNQLA